MVQTPKGLRPIDLEGFSEDLNQDGFVDPIAPAVPAPLPAPILRTVPFAAPFAAPAPVAVPATVAAPAFAAAPFAPFVHAPIARTVVATPSVVKTISPLPVPVRA